jgi:hypothetical protein
MNRLFPIPSPFLRHLRRGTETGIEYHVHFIFIVELCDINRQLVLLVLSKFSKRTSIPNSWSRPHQRLRALHPSSMDTPSNP